MAATIKDIAKALQISTSTVSYALNGGPRRVPDEVKERVFEVAKQLGYRPNRIARSLVTRRTRTIAVVPTAIVENLTLIPFFQSSFNGIVNQCKAISQDVLVYAKHDAHDRLFINDLLDGRADGAIFLAPRADSPVLVQVEASGFPFVVLSAYSKTSAPSFVCQNAEGVALAVRHLYDLGHRRIAHAHGNLHLDDGIERRNAFLHETRKLNLDIPESYVVNGNFTPAGGYQAAIELFGLPKPPTAIFCANDEIVTGVMRYCWENGITIPGDVSLVGYDNSVASMSALPPFTTIHQPFTQMAASAVDALIDLIEERPTESRKFSAELIIRESTTRPKEDTK